MTKAISHARAVDSLARTLLFAAAAMAGGALWVVPAPAWGWAALRAFLQF